MFDIATVDEERIKQVTAPFSMDVMREFFVDKNKIFVIDYEKSELKGKSLLIYLSNLDIPSEIKFGESVPVDEKFEMVKAYMESRNLFSVPSFTATVAELMFAFKKMDVGRPYGVPLLNDEELAQFLETHNELVERYVQFFDSIPYYAITTSKAYREEFKGEVEEGVETVDDPFYVGQNVVDLFFLNHFFEFYFSELPEFTPRYFKRQFEEQMFRGKNLFSYFSNPNNTMLGMLLAAEEGLSSSEEMEAFLKERESNLAP